MEDKLTNLLIMFIFVVVLILGGLFISRLTSRSSIIASSPKVIADDILVGVERTQENKTNTNVNTNTTPNPTPNPNVNTNTNVNTNINVNTNTSVNTNTNTNTNTNINTNTNTNTNTTQKPNVTPVTPKSRKEVNNRYYYNQLNDYSKAIYDALENNIDVLKTGRTKIDINYDFSKLLSQKDGNKLLEIYYNDAVTAFDLDMPYLFYISYSKMLLNTEYSYRALGTVYKSYINCGENSNYFSEGFNNEVEVEEAIKTVEAVRDYVISDLNSDDYSKLRLVHDWIIDYLTYDGSKHDKGTVYGALITKRAVCEGYARTYKYLLDCLGIENILAIGTGTNSKGEKEEHMWNYVKLGGIWYAVDCTWDDPIVRGGGTIGYEVKHRYFLIGSAELFKSHVEKRQITDNGVVFNLPTLNKSNY